MDNHKEESLSTKEDIISNKNDITLTKPDQLVNDVAVEDIDYEHESNSIGEVEPVSPLPIEVKTEQSKEIDATNSSEDEPNRHDLSSISNISILPDDTQALTSVQEHFEQHIRVWRDYFRLIDFHQLFQFQLQPALCPCQFFRQYYHYPQAYHFVFEPKLVPVCHRVK